MFFFLLSVASEALRGQKGNRARLLFRPFFHVFFSCRRNSRTREGGFLFFLSADGMIPAQCLIFPDFDELL